MDDDDDDDEAVMAQEETPVVGTADERWVAEDQQVEDDDNVDTFAEQRKKNLTRVLFGQFKAGDENGGGGRAIISLQAVERFSIQKLCL
jgi:hypothetical protein